MKKKLIALFLASLMIFALAAGCNKDDAQQPDNGDNQGEQGDQNQDNNTDNNNQGGEKTLIVRAMGDPQTFNPDLSGDDNAYPIVQNVFNRLCKLDAQKDVIPDLAESWEFTDDGKTLTFHLRSGVKWHDVVSGKVFAVVQIGRAHV